MRILLILLGLQMAALSGYGVQGQAKPQGGEAAQTGSISGVVTIQDAPAVGIVVALMSTGAVSDAGATMTTTTDSQGHFQLTGIAAGTYQVVPIAPVMLVANQDKFYLPGRQVILAPGEIVEGIHISLVPGGVISGRVTGPDGAPVIETNISLLLTDGNTRKTGSFFQANRETLQTDDRGYYRIYGLPAGQYQVSVGINPKSQLGSLRGSSAYHTQVFYPGTTDQSQAKLVEVTPGSEVNNIDIVLGKPAHGFSVSGHVIDADTGQPAPGIRLGYGLQDSNKKALHVWTFGASSNANGDFRIEGFVPGHYGIGATTGETKYYSDAALFDVSDSDVGGLEVKLHHGISIGGLVTIDGLASAEAALVLPLLYIGYDDVTDVAVPNSGICKISADGSFHCDGLRPGEVRLSISSITNSSAFSIARIDLDGVSQSDGIRVDGLSDVTGLHILVSRGTAIVHGLVSIVGGTLPPGAEMKVAWQRLTEPATRMNTESADARGAYLINGLAAGEYEISVIIYYPLQSGASPRVIRQKQTIMLTSGVTSELNFVVNLSGNN